MPFKTKRRKAEKTAKSTPTRKSSRISAAQFLDTEAQARSVKAFFLLLLLLLLPFYNFQWKGKSPLNSFQSVVLQPRLSVHLCFGLVCFVLFCFVLCFFLQTVSGPNPLILENKIQNLPRLAGTFFFFPKKKQTNKQTNKPAETLFKHKNTPGARHSNILNLKLTSNSVFSNSGGSAHGSDDDDEESGSASPGARYRNNNDDND